ncbi:MAG: aspartate-semialdehyde dehydrogenase, partial [Acidobacteria bacterium]|nr:aspartate-semialdehyde dehydrogenase [Acidobacteriota bacterium]
MSTKIEAGVLGATGTVGQEFIAGLADHPWFEVGWIGASERSAGKAYRDATPWRLPAARPDRIADMTVDRVTPGRAPKLLFSGLDASVAGEVEAEFARAGHVVVSNARNHRMDPLVPLVIPEVNADHLDLLDEQGAARGWSGPIVTNPNCSTIVLALALAPLRPFGL